MSFRAAIAFLIGTFASPIAAAQQAGSLDAGVQRSVGTEAAHKFILEALVRAEASYRGIYKEVGAGILLEPAKRFKGSNKLTNYVGNECQSSFVFGEFTLVVDWSQITDVYSQRANLSLIGRFGGSNKIDTHEIGMGSLDLTARVASAASALQRACDPLKSSGF